MTVVAVTGGTGRIGAPLVRELVRTGRQVRALTRRARAAEPGVEWVKGDLHDAGAITELVRGAEVVFHAAGQQTGDASEVERSLVGGTEVVLRAATSARVVHLSSLVVLHTAAIPHSEIDEQSPLEPTPVRRGIYTQAKVAAEKLARAAAANQDVVIVRPGLVIDSTSLLPAAVGWRRGSWVILSGPGPALLPVVVADDVATGLVLASERLRQGEVLHLVDPRPSSRTALLEWLTRSEPRPRVVDAGAMLLRLAAVAAASRIPRISTSAYRLLSAATPHRWGAAKAVQLGWQPESRWRQHSRSNS